MWVLPACTEEPLPPPYLPETQVLSLRNNWVVVAFSYLALYASDSLEGDVLWVARQGDVFEVLEQSLEREFLYSSEEHWYFLRNDRAEGWAFGAGLHSFSTLEEAENAAYRLGIGEGF